MSPRSWRHQIAGDTRIPLSVKSNLTARDCSRLNASTQILVGFCKNPREDGLMNAQTKRADYYDANERGNESVLNKGGESYAALAVGT
jgi:hypothetical protein